MSYELSYDNPRDGMQKKFRKKHWYDQNIKKYKFAISDLVLVYTLKKHERKLNKKELGPYVIFDINTSIAICLESLDGQQII